MKALQRPGVRAVAPCAIVLLAGLLLVQAPASAAPDLERLGRAEVDLAFQVGGIASAGTKEATGNAAGAFDFWLTWRAWTRVRLGWRVGLIVGAMEWGKDSGGGNAWTPGVPAFRDYGWKTTLLPHIGLVIAIDLVRGIALDLAVGMAGTFAAPMENIGGVYLTPCITAGVGALFDIVSLDAATIALAVRLDYVGSWLKRSKGTLAPQVGVQFRF